MMVSARQVLNYLGYGEQVPDDGILREITRAEEDLAEACGEAKSATGIWALDINGDSLVFGKTAIKSTSLAGHLKNAKFISLVAVTLGPKADMLIHKLGVRDMRRSLVTGAVASVLANDHCRNTCREAAGNPLVAGLTPTKRFSPGYGDFGLEYQREILRLLDAAKRIGLTLTEGNMLVPTKSVTAVVGFATNDIMGA